MASCKLMSTKDGRRFWKISVSRGHGKSPYVTRFYWKDEWSEKYALREMHKAAAEFEHKCHNGEIQNRAEREEQRRAEAAEAAKLKTVEQYANGVFMPTKEQTISENTRATYQQHIDLHIVPAIGSVMLQEVTPAMIQKLLLDYQRSGHAHGSTIKLYNILKGIFDMAFMDDSIAISPMLKVKRPAPSKDERARTEEREQAKAYTAEELKYILSCLENEPLQWRAYITLAADTGARRGELCGLYWEDINWKAETVTIKRNLQYKKGSGVYETSTKTGKTRTVDIGKDTINLLKQLRQQQAQTCISKYVFTHNGTPEPMHPQSPTGYFKKTFGKRYGVKDFHPHKLRHTSASIAITNGADVVSVSARLGHADASTTLRMYAHANEEGIRRAGETVRAALKVSTG